MKLSKLLKCLYDSEVNIAVQTEGTFRYIGRAANVPFDLARRQIVSVNSDGGKLVITIERGAQL